MNKHYWNRYIKFIKWCDAQDLPESEYTEKHHIMPRCFGGDNSKDNLIKLPYRAHILAHWMLAKAFPKDYKLNYAFVRSNSKLNLKTLEARKSYYQKLGNKEQLYNYDSRIFTVINIQTLECFSGTKSELNLLLNTNIARVCNKSRVRSKDYILLPSIENKKVIQKYLQKYKLSSETKQIIGNRRLIKSRHGGQFWNACINNKSKKFKDYTITKLPLACSLH